jgi:alpha-L-fucosidase
VPKILICVVSLLLVFVSCKKDPETGEVGSLVPFEVGSDIDIKPKFPLESREKWKLIKVDSFQVGHKGQFVFDGKPGTFWHSPWKRGLLTKHPHEIQIDMGEELEIHGFTYLPRQDKLTNGTIKKYEFYVSQELGKWDKAHLTGEFACSKNNLGVQHIDFDSVKCRYIRLVALGEINKKPWTCIAELNVIVE